MLATAWVKGGLMPEERTGGNQRLRIQFSHAAAF
jgi:hypothetical protein